MEEMGDMNAAISKAGHLSRHEEASHIRLRRCREAMKMQKEVHGHLITLDIAICLFFGIRELLLLEIGTRMV